MSKVLSKVVVYPGEPISSAFFLPPLTILLERIYSLRDFDFELSTMILITENGVAIYIKFFLFWGLHLQKIDMRLYYCYKVIRIRREVPQVPD